MLCIENGRHSVGIMFQILDSCSLSDSYGFCGEGVNRVRALGRLTKAEVHHYPAHLNIHLFPYHQVAPFHSTHWTF